MPKAYASHLVALFSAYRRYVQSFRLKRVSISCVLKAVGNSYTYTEGRSGGEARARSCSASGSHPGPPPPPPPPPLSPAPPLGSGGGARGAGGTSRIEQSLPDQPGSHWQKPVRHSPS